MKQKGFSDEADRLKKLSELGDSLERINEHIEWNDFQKPLNKAFKKRSAGTWRTSSV